MTTNPQDIVDNLKSYLSAVIRANNDTNDAEQVGRTTTASGALHAIRVLEDGIVTSLGFEYPAPSESLLNKIEIEIEYHDPPTYIVRIGDYAYLAEPHEVGQIKVGQRVDVESRNGGHWHGIVTEIQTVEDYEDTEGELPSLHVRGIVLPA